MPGIADAVRNHHGIETAGQQNSAVIVVARRQTRLFFCLCLTLNKERRRCDDWQESKEGSYHKKLIIVLPILTSTKISAFVTHIPVS
jgi:hypothetical protein